MVLRIKYLEYNDLITEKNSIICLGFFDGMHEAHQKLIRTASEIAKKKELILAVFTFNTGILDFIRNESYSCLTTIEDKAEICEALDVDILYVMRVSRHLVQMEASEFITRFLEGSHTVVVGFDFHFGYRGTGDRNLLQKNNKFKTVVIPEMKYLDLKIGTTRIRANLLAADLDLARTLLGRDYGIKGRVVSGRGIGRRLGYPTANIDYSPYFLPKSGVYYTKILHKGKSYLGLTNIGIKPTYLNVPLTVETHVFDLNQNLYNEVIQITFLEYLRQEIKFHSEEELIAQILKDVENVKTKIKEAPHEKTR